MPQGAGTIHAAMERALVTVFSRRTVVSRRYAAIGLAITVPLALALAFSSPAAAHDDAAHPAAKAGESCKKKGQVQGNLTCKRVNGRLQWVKSAGAATASSTADPLCVSTTYTSQVKNLRCSGTEITFNSNGLPSPSTPTMIGITATNQQYPSAHNYTYTFPRTPVVAATPTVPGDGAIGVAVDGVPLFSPWTQAALLQHTLDAGELDECGGHAGRGDDYHYHIAPKCLINELGADKVERQALPIGIANDGYPIRALGWFDPTHSVAGQLDKCRGMKDAKGNYFYNVQSTSKWNILDCFTGTVFRTSRDQYTTRRDAAGNEIVGAKVSLTITNSYAKVASSQTCHVMSGILTNQKVIQTNQSVVNTSGPTSIFYCTPKCYAEFFEPTAQFPGQSVYLEKVTSSCPVGFDPSTISTIPAYTGPDIGKRGPATGGGAPAR